MNADGDSLEARGRIVELWLAGAITDEDFKILMKAISKLIGESTPAVQ